MKVLLEGRREIIAVRGDVHSVQCRPELLAEPLLVGDTLADGAGVSIYGSVLQDGGTFRMWYQGWPRGWPGGSNSHFVCYAESSDGLTWRKPHLGIVDYGGSSENHLTDLPFHSPAVFIDETAPASARYRATGWIDPDDTLLRQWWKAPAQGVGYYGAHSADGLRWTLDQPVPLWSGIDVITSVWDPYRKRGVCAVRLMPISRCYHGVNRRCISISTMQDGRWSAPVSAIIPDEFDDAVARMHGFASGDYYGMGLMPTEDILFGFIWHFRHRLPYRGNFAVFGSLDIGLAYQQEPGGRWQHFPRGVDFLSHDAFSWTQGGLYTASNVVTAGDQDRLYICATELEHGSTVNTRFEVDHSRMRHIQENGMAKIGLARWPRGRLVGLQTKHKAELDVRLEHGRRRFSLLVNGQAESCGAVRFAIVDPQTGDPLPGYGPDDCLPLIGDPGIHRVAFGGRNIIEPPGESTYVVLRMLMDTASIYGYEMARPAT